MTRYLLTDAQWARLEPLLPPARPRTGRPNKDHRVVVEAILWRLRAGAPWRDLPAEFGPWQTAYSRFRRWQAAGVWGRALAALQAKADADGGFDWTLHFLDGTTVRAHQDAAGAKKGAATALSAAPAAASRRRSTSGPSGAAGRSASS
jgi:transposase